MAATTTGRHAYDNISRRTRGNTRVRGIGALSESFVHCRETLLRVPVPILVTTSGQGSACRAVSKKGHPAVEPPGAHPRSNLGGGEWPLSPVPLEERDFYEGYSVGISNGMKPDLRPCVKRLNRKAIRTSASRRSLSQRPHCHGAESSSSFSSQTRTLCNLDHRRRYSDPWTAPLPYDFRRYLIGAMSKVHLTETLTLTARNSKRGIPKRLS
jgi:hypothetical protein